MKMKWVSALLTAAFLVTAVPVSVSAEYSALSGELTAAVKRVPLSIEETQKK